MASSDELFSILMDYLGLGLGAASPPVSRCRCVCSNAVVCIWSIQYGLAVIVVVFAVVSVFTMSQFWLGMPIMDAIVNFRPPICRGAIHIHIFRKRNWYDPGRDNMAA